MKKFRFLSLCMAVALLLGMLPGVAFANDAAMWSDRDVFDFESDLASAWSSGAGAVSAEKAYAGAQSLKLGIGETAKHSVNVASNLLKAAWYRISGYVYLNGADASKVSIKLWRRNASNANSVETYALNNAIVRLGDTDANGWTYFEFDFQHEKDQNSHSFHLINSSSAAVYLDNLKYSKYLGEGEPPIPAKDMSASLTLNDSFAINFKIAAAEIDAPTRVDYCDANGVVLKSEDVTGIIANASGKYVFSYTGIAPHNMSADITANVYEGEKLVAKGTASVLDLCNAYLASDMNELAVLAMEVLDYGAAAQKYVDANATDLVNTHVATAYKDIWTQSAGLIFDYENDLEITGEVDAAAATWSAVGLYLDDRISIRYTIRAASVDGLTAKITCGDDVWTVSDFEAAGEGKFKFYFDGLNPAQMRDDVVVTIMNGETPVSKSLTYSIESYVADKFAGNDKILKTLLQEMLYYGDAAANYIDALTEGALWSEMNVDMSVNENSTIVTGPGWQQTTATVTIANDKGYNDNYSFKIAAGGVGDNYTGSLTQTAGWYRVSGYVYLNGVNPANVAIRMWQRKADNSGNNTPEFNLGDYLVGAPDANGWSYFEFNFQQLYYTAYHRVRIFNRDTGSAVYFDDLKLEKYQGEGKPAMSEWDVLIDKDFENAADNNLSAYDQFLANGFTDKSNSRTQGVVADNTRAGSTEVLHLPGQTRVQLSDSTFTSYKAGYYKLSGYVNLGNNPNTDTIMNLWVYGANGNMVTKTLEQCVVGQKDANGWQYFEVVYQRTNTSVSLIQFILGDNTLGWEIWLDDIQYSVYVGDGTPVLTD